MDSTIQSPTLTYADELQRAYDHFNATLFEDRLPGAVITYTNRKKVYGHFGGKRWEAGEDHTADEIAMNPSHFRSRPVGEVLSTLVHEMTHQEQAHFGKPGRRGYHNIPWGLLMDRVGLTPSSTGSPGGKRTGQKVSHYIDPEGPFQASLNDLMETGYTLTWAKAPVSATSRKAPVSKVPYECLPCGMKVWGKPGLRVGCFDCEELMVEGG